ncbi:MAG: oligoribonuclease [Candidatus Saccharibacteria bacterium]
MSKKISDSKQDNILWIDLEMTGLSPTDDLILEVAAIVTDWDFKEVASYQGVVKNNISIVNQRMDLNSAFWDINPDSKNGLIKQNQDGKPLKTIENELLSFIKKHFKSGIPVLLCGNSIHVDRRFIIAKWPKFDSCLHYRMLDVSAWKVVFEGKFGKKFSKPDMHRALDDIRGSIQELQYYLKKLK